MNARDMSESSVPQAFVDELLSRTSMTALVGRRVLLERASNGRVWKATCQYHDDDGTSFYVHEDGFHCFGCGAHGNAIDFVMRSASVTFDEAVETLSDMQPMMDGCGKMEAGVGPTKAPGDTLPR